MLLKEIYDDAPTRAAADAAVARLRDLATAYENPKIVEFVRDYSLRPGIGSMCLGDADEFRYWANIVAGEINSQNSHWPSEIPPADADALLGIGLILTAMRRLCGLYVSGDFSPERTASHHFDDCRAECETAYAAYNAAKKALFQLGEKIECRGLLPRDLLAEIAEPREYIGPESAIFGDFRACSEHARWFCETCEFDNIRGYAPRRKCHSPTCREIFDADAHPRKKYCSAKCRRTAYAAGARAMKADDDATALAAAGDYRAAADADRRNRGVYLLTALSARH